MDPGSQSGSDVQADLDHLTPDEREARELLDDFERTYKEKLKTWHLVAIETSTQSEANEIEFSICQWASENQIYYGSDFIMDGETELNYLRENRRCCSMRFRDPQTAMLVKLIF